MTIGANLLINVGSSYGEHGARAYNGGLGGDCEAPCTKVQRQIPRSGGREGSPSL